MGERTRLELDHIAYADYVAHRRRELAVENERPARNGAPVEHQAALALDLLGARCECAGYLALGGRDVCTWNALARDVRNLPDIDDWIDVKGVAKRRHRLIVQKNSPEGWAYLLVCAERHPDYEMVGWLWGREAMVAENWSDPRGDAPAYFVSPDKLRPFDELRALMAWTSRLKKRGPKPPSSFM